MNDIATEELAEFFDYMWHDTQGYVYLPVEQDGKWSPYMFAWPRQRAAVVRHVLKWSAIAANVFYSPAVYKAARPIKANVLGSWVLWVDFDGNAPEVWPDDLVPEPTMKVRSSLPRHQHCYWQLDKFLDDISLLEDRNRSLAYTLKADTSGWDADQILRPIHTTNHKRNLPVVIEEWADHE